MGREQDVLGRIVRWVDGYLGDEPDAPARADDDLALVGLQLAHDEAKERRLARAVLAEQAHALSGVDLKGKAVEYLFVDLKGFRDAFDGNVYHESSRIRRSGFPRGPREREAREARR